MGFFSQIFRIHRAAGEGRGYLFISFLLLQLTSETLLQRARLCAKLAAKLEPGSLGFLMQFPKHLATRSVEFALHTLALAAVVVRRMVKTQVTVGNISRALLNLIKKSN